MVRTSSMMSMEKKEWGQRTKRGTSRTRPDNNCVQPELLFSSPPTLPQSRTQEEDESISSEQ
jgi:hypothetical protein